MVVDDLLVFATHEPNAPADDLHRRAPAIAARGGRSSSGDTRPEGQPTTAPYLYSPHHEGPCLHGLPADLPAAGRVPAPGAGGVGGIRGGGPGPAGEPAGRSRGARGLARALGLTSAPSAGTPWSSGSGTWSSSAPSGPSCAPSSRWSPSATRCRTKWPTRSCPPATWSGRSGPCSAGRASGRVAQPHPAGGLACPLPWFALFEDGERRVGAPASGQVARLTTGRP